MPGAVGTTATRLAVVCTALRQRQKSAAESPSE
jgi:hypothetical protein